VRLIHAVRREEHGRREFYNTDCR